MLLRFALALAAPLLFLGLAEGALRIVGAGHETGFLVDAGGKDASGAQLLRENPDFGLTYFPKTVARRPFPVLLAKKAVGAAPLRIAVVGSSAAMGDPEPRFGMARMLQAAFAITRPELQVEVINAAMTAINSIVAVEIARDMIDAGADVIVVYSGNNEVVGPFGPGTVLGAAAASRTAIRASVQVRKLRLGQMLGRIGGGARDAPTSWAGMEMFLERQVRADDPRLTAVVANYRANLEAIIAHAHARGARVVLATLAVNLVDCPPFASAFAEHTSASERQRFDELLQAGNAALAAGRADEAAQRYDEALIIDDTHAEVVFRHASALKALGDRETAIAQFRRARDLDTLRFRADSALQAAIREVARAHEKDGVVLLDAEAICDAQGALGIAGLETLWEHVHLKPEGNAAIATALLEVIEILKPELPPRNAVPLDLSAIKARLALSEFDELATRRELARRMQRAPFVNQADHSDMLARFDAATEALALRVESSEGRAAAYAAYSTARAQSPEDWVLADGQSRLLSSLGDHAGATAALESIIALIPHHAEARHLQAVSLYQQGQKDRAATRFQEALSLDPDNGLAHLNYAQTLAAAGRDADAIEHLELAVALLPDEPRARIGLAAALERAGRSADARVQYLECARLARAAGEEASALTFEERARSLAPK